MYKIIKLIKSKRQNKRYRVYLENNDHYDFGLDTGKTYIDHQNITKRDNYRKRHLGNDTEKHLIKNLIPSPALFSYYILWGDSTDINKNINILNKMFN